MSQGWPKARPSLFLCCPHIPSPQAKSPPMRILVLLLQFYSVRVSISASEPAVESITSKAVPQTSSKDWCTPKKHNVKAGVVHLSLSIIDCHEPSTSACFQLPPSHAPRSSPASQPAATALGSYTPFPTAQVCFTGSTDSSNSTIRHLPSTLSWICITVLRYSARSLRAAPPPNRRSLGSSIRRSV
jgi:hypothetical protein